MRIALFNVMVHYNYGGAEAVCNDLKEQLADRGHDVTLFRIPWVGDYMKLPELVFSSVTMDFSEYDIVIPFKFPTYCVMHKHKNTWLPHQFRQVYDLWNTKYGFSDEIKWQTALKEIVTQTDNNTLPNSANLFTNAQNTANRLKQYNNIDGQALYPPTLGTENYFCKSYGDYIYYPSRITVSKRQHLAVEAMKYTKTNVKLIIDGKYDQGDTYGKEIEDLIKKNNLQNKVTLENRFVTEEEKTDKYSRCLAVVYPPMDEDFGLITIEAFYSEKALITCKDSGGPTYFVQNGVNGFITETDPKEIAKKIDELYNDRKKAKKMGENAKKYINEQNITWDKTIERLLK
jgi:glycosyltransferase involved in cell wall biosynthesis